MNPPLDPAELSALLDGELPPVRAQQVRTALEADPVLAARYAALAADHQQWTAAAQAAAFGPTIDLAPATAPAPSAAPRLPLIAPGWITAAAILAAAGLVHKIWPLGLLATSALHTALLAAILATLIRSLPPITPDSPSDLPPA